MSRRFFFTVAGILVLTVLGLATYVALEWQVRNPLEIRIHQMARNAQGQMVMDLEVRNASRFPIWYESSLGIVGTPKAGAAMGTNQIIADHRHGELLPQTLAPGKPVHCEAVADSAPALAGYDLHYDYTWTPVSARWMQNANSWLRQRLPDPLAEWLPRFRSLRLGECGVESPGLAGMPATP